MPGLLPSPTLYPSSSLFPGSDPIGPFTKNLLDSMAPWLVNDDGSHFTYLVALGAMFDGVASVVMDQGFPDDPEYLPGWSTLLDPDLCPTLFLAYLGQFNGTGVMPGTDDLTARSIVKAESGFNRGTVASFRSAIERAQQVPNPSKYAIQERTGTLGADPYHFLVSIDLQSLATQGDPTQLIANLNAVKPAGLQFTIVPLTAPLLSQYARLLSAVVVPLNVAQLSDVS